MLTGSRECKQAADEQPLQDPTGYPSGFKLSTFTPGLKDFVLANGFGF